MIGEAQRVLSGLPSGFPWDLIFVNKQTHEFGYGDRRMSVVHLNGALGMKILQGAFDAQVNFD